MALSMILLLQLRVRARAGVYPCAPHSGNAEADAWCPDQAQSNMIGPLCIYQSVWCGPTGFGLSRQPIELCAIGPLAFFTCFLLFDSVTGVVSIVS